MPFRFPLRWIVLFESLFCGEQPTQFYALVKVRETGGPVRQAHVFPPAYTGDRTTYPEVVY